jgi:hypothetical protein
LPPVVLQNDTSPEVGKAVAHFLCSVDDNFELDIRRRVEIEDKAAGKGGIAGLVVPGMELDARTLRYGRQTLDTIDLHIGLAIAGDRDLLKQALNARSSFKTVGEVRV